MNERNALKAGLFIVFSIIAAVGVLVGIKGAGRVVQTMQVRQASFTLNDDISGLRPGDDVRLGGFKVGTVKSIDTDVSGSEPRILVTFNLPDKFVLHQDSDVAVQSTLTGTASLNISRLGAGAPLAEGVPVPGKPGVMSSLLAQLQSLAPDAVGIAHDVRTVTVPHVNEAVATFHQTGEAARELVGHVASKVDPVLERYDRVTDKALGVMGDVREVLGDSKSDIRGTISHLNVVTRSVEEKLPGLLDQVHGLLSRVDDSITRAGVALEDIKQTAANSRDLTASARSIIIGNKSRIDALIASFKATSDNLKAASVEVRHSPWRLLYKPGANEMANLNVYDSAREFAEGAGGLNDAAGALRDALHDPRSDSQQIRKLMDNLDVSFSNFQSIEQKLWNAVKD